MVLPEKAAFDSVRRIPVVIAHDGTSVVRDVYGFSGNAEKVFLEGTLLMRNDCESKTLLLFMHPSSSLSLLPATIALAEAGFHVMCCGSRYLRNDTALILENVLVDLGAYMRFARERLSYRNVVLVGWSGGGSLSVLYQAEAERTTIDKTPAGDPIDLGSADLSSADGLILIAAHLSRAETLTRWLDPSIVDELDPDRKDRSLDIYDPESEHQPPYSRSFIEEFRNAQYRRNRRISEWCFETMETLARAGSGEYERCFITHRTMADPYWLDVSIDPNERKPGVCYLGDPRVVNMSAVGLARFSTLRAWLSQWSIDFTQAKSSDCAPRVTVPALVIENTADDATPSTDPGTLFNLLGSEDKSLQSIRGATHYYQGQPDKLRELANLCTEWLSERNLEAA